MREWAYDKSGHLYIFFSEAHNAAFEVQFFELFIFTPYYITDTDM